MQWWCWWNRIGKQLFENNYQREQFDNYFIFYKIIDLMRKNKRRKMLLKILLLNWYKNKIPIIWFAS